MAGGITLARGIIEGFGEIWMDLLKKKVGKLVYLTKKGFELLYIFLGGWGNVS